MITTSDPLLECQNSWPNASASQTQLDLSSAGKPKSQPPNETDDLTATNKTDNNNSSQNHTNFEKPAISNPYMPNPMVSENLNILRPLFQRVSDFNFDFDADGILRHLQSGEPFSMKMASNVPSLKRQEMIRAICTRLVRQRLFELKMESSQIPIPGHPHLCLRVLHSSNFFTHTGPILIILQAGGVSQAGVWAPRLLLHAQHGLRSGSQISLVQKALVLGYAVAIVNANEHVPSEAEMDTIEIMSAVQNQVVENSESKFADKTGHSIGSRPKLFCPSGSKAEVCESNVKPTGSCSTVQPLSRQNFLIPERPPNPVVTNSSAPLQSTSGYNNNNNNNTDNNIKPPAYSLPSTSLHPSTLSSLLAGPSSRTLTPKTQTPNLLSQPVAHLDATDQPSGPSTSHLYPNLVDKSSIINSATSSESNQTTNSQHSGDSGSQQSLPPLVNPIANDNPSTASPCLPPSRPTATVSEQPLSSTIPSSQGANLRFTVTQFPNLHSSNVYLTRRLNPADNLNFLINNSFNRSRIPTTDEVYPSHRPVNRFSNEYRMSEVSLEDRIYGIWRHLVPHCASNQIYVWAHQQGAYAFVHPLTPMPGVFPGFPNPSASTNYLYSGTVHLNSKFIPPNMSLLNYRTLGGSVGPDGFAIADLNDKRDAVLIQTNWPQAPLIPSGPSLTDKFVLQSCSQFMSQPVNDQIVGGSSGHHSIALSRPIDQATPINQNPQFIKPQMLSTIAESHLMAKCKTNVKEHLVKSRIATRTRLFPHRRRHLSAGPVLVSSKREEVDSRTINYQPVEQMEFSANGIQPLKPQQCSKDPICILPNYDFPAETISTQSQTSSGRVWLDRRVYGPWRYHVTPEAARRAFWMPDDNPVPDDEENQSHSVPLPSGNLTDAAVSAQRGGVVPRSTGIWSSMTSTVPGSSTHDKSSLHFRLLRAWQRKAERLWHEISTRVRAVVFTDSPDLLDLRTIGVGWGLSMLQDSKTSEDSSSNSSPRPFRPSNINNAPPEKVTLVRKWFSEHAVHFVASGLPINTRVDQHSDKSVEIPILSSGTAEHDLIPTNVLDEVFDFFKSRSEQSVSS